MKILIIGTLVLCVFLFLFVMFIWYLPKLVATMFTNEFDPDYAGQQPAEQYEGWEVDEKG